MTEQASLRSALAEDLEAPPVPKKSRGQEFWRLLRSNRLAFIGLIIFLVFFGIAVLGLFLTSGSHPVFDPSMVRLQEKLRPPLSRPRVELLRPEQIPPLGIYLFGTDELGRDVFSRMLQGAWVSLTVGFVAVGISVAIGIFMGGIAGYYGNAYVNSGHICCVILMSLTGILIHLDLILFSFCAAIALAMVCYLSKRRIFPFQIPIMTVDTLIVGIVDIMLCFPSFFLILTVIALLPPSIYNIMAVIGLTSWMGAARFVRAEFLSLREQDFVLAARALGLNDLRIIFRHMMPNAMGPVLVSATIGIASAILTEAGLSFLGFGVPPPHATWGNILSDGKRFIFDAPWLTFIPGTAILIVVLAFNLFGEGLRDILNPRLRERSL